MDKKLVEKFFMNRTTPEETEQVLQWFDTPEGKQYVEERLEMDSDLMEQSALEPLVPELDSDQLYQSIQKKVHSGKTKKIATVKKPEWFGPVFKAVAAVLVILATLVFYVTNDTNSPETIAERTPTHIQTIEDQHREVTLSDGSRVRLNSNSEMVISKDFMQGAREVTLAGEAYFEVAPNADRPFIIHAKESVIEVLGTSFNVRTFPEQNNVQVAVVEGRVSFVNKTQNTEQEQLSVVLSKGQYGYMDTIRRTILVDDLAVENYLAWKSGRFVFEEHTLQQVCTQLNRLYDIVCTYADEEIRELLITANFSNESLDKTLAVIALSLNIEFQHKGNRVLWSYENPRGGGS